MNQAVLDSLLAKQQQLEDNCLAEGAARFRRQLQQAQEKGAASRVGAAHRLMKDAIDPMSKAVQAMIDDANAPGRKGRKHVAVKWCQMTGADVVAYITAKQLLDNHNANTNSPGKSRPTVRASATAICDLITDELKYRRFRERAKGLFEYRLRSFNTTSYAHMARSLDGTLRHAICADCRANGKEHMGRACEHLDMSDLEMTQNVSMQVGYKLIELFRLTTSLIEIETVNQIIGRRLKTNQYTKLTQETVEWMDARNAKLEWQWPVNLPMVVPPLPWSQGERGGYRFAMRGKHALVRVGSKETLRAVDATPMPQVYEAVNRIQETAWKINPHVLALVEEIARRGGAMAGVPALRPVDEPRKPPEIEEFESILKANRYAKQRGEQKVPLSDEVQAYKDEWTEWRGKAHEAKELNHMRKVRGADFLKVLSTALAVKDENAIWFPCNLDFRGRVYPIVNYLSPQGDDLSKALLTFAEGRALGPDGADWLATHGANCLGDTPSGIKLSKSSISERVTWVVTNTLDIEAVVEDPFAPENEWWTQADDPLQFYAFCVEWAAYVKLARLGKGDEYVCSLPCAMDGTCNGLQHFAALLLDSEGAEAVNVVPTPRPQDIYQRIADAVLSRLQKAAAKEDLAALWLKSGLVTRKFLKRPTMTFPYGSKKYGFREQFIELVQADDTWPTVKDLFMVGSRNLARQACGYLAELTWQALEECVHGAFHGMAWLQKAARQVAAEGKCVSWTVPGTGFPVRQSYVHIERSRSVATVLAGKLIRPSSFNPTDRPNRVKQANAVAPNFVHSLDAASLMMTVALSSREGVESFGMVHDSYATLPADCATLARCTREAFYTLYTQYNVLEHFAEQVKLLMKEPEEFPELPAKGTLDLGLVLVSEYFFS